MSIKAHCAPENSRIASEFPLPEGIAEHCSRIAARRCHPARSMYGRACALTPRLAKEVSADVKTFGKSRLAAIREIETRRAPGQHARERLLLCTDLLPLRIGHRRAAAGPPSRSRGTLFKIDGHQFLRVLNRQHFEANRVHKLENRCVCTYTQCER